MEPRPSPEETRPPLTAVGQAWRIAACLVFSAVLWIQIAEVEWREARGLFWAELALGVVSYVLVLFRRRAPVPIALVIAAMSAFSGVAAGPATLAAVSVATSRRVVPIVVVGTVNFACAMTYTLLAPWDLQQPVWVSVLINLVVNGGMMGWGMYIGSRREVVWNLRNRAQRAEAEQELRVRQAQVTERSRIAREMHDVLAHRITQVSMQAGALAFREDLEAPRLRQGLTQIQGQANEALRELRGVLGVLRDDTTGEPLEQPQPHFDDIAALVETARTGGMDVTYENAVDHNHRVPDATGRTLYRIVQEGMTNARKHAPGTRLTVRVSGDPESGLQVLLRNPLGSETTSRAPGAGLGLVGLRERAVLSGGHLDATVEGSSFVVRGWIPWAA